jgi:hypothetical protein
MIVMLVMVVTSIMVTMTMDNNDYNLDWWFIAVMDDGGNGDIAIVIDEVMVIHNEQWWMTAMKMAIGIQ